MLLFMRVYMTDLNPKKLIEVCPVCGSSNVDYEMGGYIGKVYHCKDCDYTGALILEADKELIDAIKEDFEKEK
jgi:hypothetical protein